MLIRAALIYCLAVSTVLFAAIAAWQRIEIAASHDSLAALTERAESLQRDFDRASADAASAKRLAEAAQDSLARSKASHAERPDADQLSQQLADISRDRDAARSEAAALAREAGAGRQEAARMKDELANLQLALEEARRANDEAEAARMSADKELQALRAAMLEKAPASLVTGTVLPPKSPVAEAAMASPGAAGAQPGQVADAPAKADLRRAAEAREASLIPSAAATQPAAAAPESETVAPAKKAASKRRKKPKAAASEAFAFPF